MTKIRYIGAKASKQDNVAGTGIIWSGRNAVKDVPGGAVDKLLLHPDVWELADGTVRDQPEDQGTQEEVQQEEAQQEEVEDDSPPMVSLDSMEKDALKQYAQRYFNHQFHHATGETKMRQVIVGLMNRG